MKKVIAILFALIISIVIVMLPRQYSNKFFTSAYSQDSLIPQQVEGRSEEVHEVTKIYDKGQLIGVINDYDVIQKRIDAEYQKYEEKFPNTELGFGENVYVTTTHTINNYENIDDKIADYLVDNGLLGVKATMVEFSTAEGVYEIIYVSNIDLYNAAQVSFLTNFISEDTLYKLQTSETIASPTDFGTVEKNAKIEETITYKEVVVSPDKIFTTFNEVYNFLCYGRNTERQYYTTVEGDTLSGVGYYFGNLSAKQVAMLNPDKIKNENQILVPGTTLNVTYYTSPITVTVTKERLAQQVVYPDLPIYREDESLTTGSREIITEEVNGLKNVLYEEKWVNGVLQEGKELSSQTISQPVQGIIAVGTGGAKNIVGTGTFIWPTETPAISCGWGCYAGHTGEDIVNLYNPYGPVLAADSGVVERAEYGSIDGNFVVINHQNGFKTHYGHMTQYYVKVGDYVQRGQVIGQIGMTGWATGPHIHFHFLVDGLSGIQDPCDFMNCDEIR